MYSNYFKIVSTVTFLDSQTGLISSIFLFKTVSLYTIYNDYTRYNVCSAWFLNIVISSCSNRNTSLSTFSGRKQLILINEIPNRSKYLKVVWTKGVDKLYIADLTLFMIKGSFNFAILL